MPDYIPPRDAEFAQWAQNFAQHFASFALPMGFSLDDEQAMSDAHTAWETAYAQHLTARNNARARRQTKMNARSELTELARAYARRLQAHPDMTDAMRADFGITLPGANAVPNPGVIPTSRPVVTVDTAERLRHLIDWVDEESGSRRRPAGVRAAEIWAKIGGEPPDDPAELTFLATATRPRYVAWFDGEHAGKEVHYMLRWISTRGQAGPWSQTISATIVA